MSLTVFRKSLCRIMCFVLAALLTAGFVPCLTAAAIDNDFEITKGQYLKWGNISGEPIVWVALSSSTDNYQGGNTVDVMTRDIVSLRSLNDRDTIPSSLGDTSLYEWLNGTKGFWSESNFPESERYLRASDFFSILNATDYVYYFDDGKLADESAAKYNGSKKAWWLWGNPSSGKTGYQVSKDGQLEEYEFDDVSSDKAGVRPVTTLNLESFYIASGKGTASNPYSIRSVYDSDLKSLTATGCVIAPGFSAGITNYTSNVTSNVESIGLTAEAKDSNAEITIYRNEEKISSSGKADVKLNYGENKIDIRVLAVDRFSETVYTLTVTRKEESRAVRLSKLQYFDEEPSFSMQPEELKISPGFSEANLSYTIDVGRSVKKGRVVVEGSPDANITITLNNSNAARLKQDSQTGSKAVFSGVFDITSDLSLITLSVSTRSGNESKKYVTNVMHGDNPLYVNENAGVSQPEEESSEPESSEPEDIGEVSDSGQTPDDPGTLKLRTPDEGAPWWLTPLIILISLAVVGGIIFAIVMSRKGRPDDTPPEESPYYVGRSSGIKQDLEKEREQAREVSDFYEMIPKNSQYRGVYDNRPGSGKKTTPYNGAPRASKGPAGSGEGYFRQNTGDFATERYKNAVDTAAGIAGGTIYTAQQKQKTMQESARADSRTSDAADNIFGGALREEAPKRPDGPVRDFKDAVFDEDFSLDGIFDEAPEKKHASDAAAFSEKDLSLKDEAGEREEKFRLDFDADKEYHFDEYIGSDGSVDDISSDSGMDSDESRDPVKSFEDRMKFDADKDIFSSTAKPEDELNGYKQ